MPESLAQDVRTRAWRSAAARSHDRRVTPVASGVPESRTVTLINRGRLAPAPGYALPLRTRREVPAVGTAALLLVASGAEAMLALALLAAAMPLASALAVHGGIAVALWWGGVLRRSGEAAQHPASLVFIVTTIALGPVGPAGMLLSMLIWKLMLRRAPRSFVLDAERAVAEPGATTPDLVERIARGEGDALEGLSVTSFCDVMSSGRFEDKQEAIVLIANGFRPSFAPALLRALNDPEPAIRVQAATAMARIERAFSKTAMALEEQAGAAPDPERLMEMARHHDRYAESGLLDGARARTARLAALSLYQEAQRRGHRDPDLGHATVRLLMRLGRPDEALEVFDTWAIQTEPSIAMRVWQIEGLYALGRYEAVRQVCRTLPELGDEAHRVPEVCREVIALWKDPEGRS